jgi:prolyl 4-hydroxylase
MQQWLPQALQTYLPPRFQAYVETTSKVTVSPTANEQRNATQLLEACKTHQYTSEIVSLNPLLIYINNFTSAHEAEELITTG